MSDEKVIFSMSKVNKIFPPKKHVLKDIWLSFFYGAKIGVLGLNGSGKSSLLKIIAGVDKDFDGEIFFEKIFVSFQGLSSLFQVKIHQGAIQAKPDVEAYTKNQYRATGD